MIHIHPFPARMAPEIALKGLEGLPSDYVVLDPMSGSGMVLGTAAKVGLKAIGYDLDPLACLISRANGRFVDSNKAHQALEKLLSLATDIDVKDVSLSWMDEDIETKKFVDFWFGKAQQRQLRILSYLLVEKPFIKSQIILDILKVAVSRLIVTKEPKASFARDTAHSRPHRTISENTFDVFNALPKSLSHVLSALSPTRIKENVKSYRGDARRMGRIADQSIDCIITSPPYLNAIDYMRGHRLSLVWLGHSVSSLRNIRSRAVGAELVLDSEHDEEFKVFLSKLHDDIDDKKKRILKRYYRDLCDLTKDAFRVLKTDREATYVMGNSQVKGKEIRNSDLLIIAAQKAGFSVKSVQTRDIPENRRYMPMKSSNKTALSKRMNQEYVISFYKPIAN
ncbi:hypothetical protein [Thalassospira sp. MCCC 1A03138]|uniref:hypothetical protein n=1 Tax=Thalassospira sp. MCCC 1A03138 TaxID=1470576 RepID=UPI000A24028F|nr:hypothetical protein [Thalassospira sp. MCCC 1A03138]OSQ32833.1 hypothetical protein TH468_04740 [Thalassospira sp. MCCC 1A03138]